MGLTGPSFFERRAIEQGVAWAIASRMHLQRHETPERAAQSDARRDQQVRIGEILEIWMAQNPEGGSPDMSQVGLGDEW